MTQPSFDPLPPQNFSLVPVVEPSQGRQISAEYFLKLGNRHYNNFLIRGIKRDLDVAIDHYHQALEMNPNLPEGYAKLAAALWDKGEINLETAIRYCRIAVQINAGYGEGHLFLGYFLRQDGNLDAAAEQFRQAIRTTGIPPAKARMALGRVLIQKASMAFEMPSLKRAALYYEGMRELAAGCLELPGDRNTFGVLQQALWMDCQIYGIQGIGQSLNMVGLQNQTVRLYEWASRRMPQESIFFHWLGDLQASRSNVDASIYYYNRAQELDPDNLTLCKKLGHAYAQCHDTINAARSLEKLVEAEVADFDTTYALAHIYLERKEYIRALYYFKDLVTQAPDNPYLHSNMAYVMFKLEDYDGAVKEYQSAVNFGEDPIWTATVAQTLGTIYYQIRQEPDRAAEMFQLAYQLDANNLESLTMLADIYTEQGQYDLAANAYRYIVMVEPDNADCYNYLGFLLWQMDENDEAIDAYQKAIRLNSDNPIAFNNLGVIYLDEKCQPHRALEMFQKALAINPDYTLASFNVGRSYEALGQITDAARMYSDTLALNAGNPELDDTEVLERLDRLFDA